MLIDWVADQAAANPAEPLAALWSSLAAQDFRSRLGDLALPVLVTHGELSQLYPPGTGVDLQARIPGSRRILFPRSGHALHLEQPDLFNQALTEFADATTRAGSTTTPVQTDPAQSQGRPST